MASDRLGRLEALLGRVRQRSTLARPALGSNDAAPIAAPLPPAKAEALWTPEKAEALWTPEKAEARFTPPGAHAAPPGGAPAKASAPPAAQAPYAQVPPMRAPMESAVTLELLDAPLEETLSEDDLVEMSSDVLESVPPGEVTELSSPELEDDDAPVSSQRPRSPNPLAEAFSRADEDDVLLDEGREVPLKTPPPESGPQEAPLPSGLGMSDAPDVDELLEADLMPPLRDRGAYESIEPPFGSSSTAATPDRPTTEQLGQTIDLEEAHGPDLELDAPTAVQGNIPVLPMLEELEVTLPRSGGFGGYDESLMSPPQALDELDAHRRKGLDAPFEDVPADASEDAPAVGAVTAENSLRALPESSLTGSSATREAFERNTLEGVIVQEIVPGAVARARPTTFLALLDASIALGG